MTDRKSFNKPQSTARKRRKAFSRVPRGIRDNEMLYTTGWTENSLQSSAGGVIGATFSPSLSYSGESGTVQSLFTEVKLISYELKMFPIQAGASGTSAAVHSYVSVGTNMIMNGTTFTTPSAIADVINLAKRVDVGSCKPVQTNYKMVVPSSLEYLSTATGSDRPTVPNPYAGSPGAVVVFGTNFGVSVPYWYCSSISRFHLRGRN